MDFGVVPIDEAEGAILAHSFRMPSGRIQKGHIVSSDDIACFRDAGVETIMVARSDVTDLSEAEAAHRLATAVAGLGIVLEEAIGGRVNLMARDYGVLVYDRSQLDALNGIHESLTLAALPPFAMVEPGQMVGTVKIIPFAVSGAILQAAEHCAGLLNFDVKATQSHDVGLIQTTLPGLPTKILTKTSSVTRHRIEGLGGRLALENQCAHDIADLSRSITAQIDAGMEIILVVGASAVTDRRDVIPAAIERAKGQIDYLGMPVDPGNLLLLGRVGEIPVVGVPGCARSPSLNGFDWVLQRLFCGLPLSAKDFAAMGAGGLLKEITDRPMPRAAAARAVTDHDLKVYGLVLAAGDDSGVKDALGGVANVALVVGAAMASSALGVYVVTGAHEDDLKTALKPYAVSFTYNPTYEDGIATSLRRGLSALPADADGVIVCLANDPVPSTAVIDALISGFAPHQGGNLCVPLRQGQRGSPLLIGRHFFAQLHELEGESGARYLIDAYPGEVIEMQIDDLADARPAARGALAR